MEYKVLTADDSNELTKIVNWEISDGWEPLGSVSIGAYVEPKAYGESEYGQILAQAMIRREANKQEVLDDERAQRAADEARANLK